MKKMAKRIIKHPVFSFKFILFISLLMVLFISSAICASNGWGYIGYGGSYGDIPTRKVVQGRVTVYTVSGVRIGNLGGPSHMGGGLSGGK